jgi:superfamily II DNA/RNA helicase
MIFCNTKHAGETADPESGQAGLPADCIHGDVKQSSREKVMAAFRAGTFGILVATDVAARGLDISGVDAVFNYDIPLENEYYIHRIGRTGRAKKHGVSYTFVSYFETGPHQGDRALHEVADDPHAFRQGAQAGARARGDGPAGYLRKPGGVGPAGPLEGVRFPV